MDFVLSTGTATTATMLLVAMFKLGFPTAASRAVVSTCLLAGLALSFLVAVAQGQPLTTQTAAISVFAGIFAAAAAAGVRAADNKADERRAEAARSE